MTKIAIVTGASGNLGKAVTTQLAQNGYGVIAAVRSVPARASINKNIEYHEYNALDPVATNTLIEKVISDHGKIDVLICLVGGFEMASLIDTRIEDIDKMVNLNFYSAFNIVQPVIEQFKHQNFRGNLVLIGAKPAIDKGAGSGVFAYAISKSLVIKLAELINADYKILNTRATVIIPSIIDTPVNRKAMPDADFDHWVTTESIANKIVFVCSEAGNDLRETVLKIYGDV